MDRIRCTRQRGSVVATFPVLMIGVLLMMGIVQLALFMNAKLTTELAAYRAHRMLQERSASLVDLRETSRRQATQVCRLGYPESLSTVHVSVAPGNSRVTVRMEAEPILASSDLQPFEVWKIQSHYPPPIGP